MQGAPLLRDGEVPLRQGRLHEQGWRPVRGMGFVPRLSDGLRTRCRGPGHRHLRVRQRVAAAIPAVHAGGAREPAVLADAAANRRLAGIGRVHPQLPFLWRDPRGRGRFRTIPDIGRVRH